MEDANGGDASTLALCRELPVQVGTFTFYVQAHIVNPAPYKIPLGQPFEYILGLESVGQANTMLLHSQEDETLTQVILTRAHVPPVQTVQVHTLQDRVASEHIGPILSGSATTLSLLRPKPKPTLRSKPTPRSQPMSSYPLYSGLVFCGSLVPISAAIKRRAQP